MRRALGTIVALALTVAVWAGTHVVAGLAIAERARAISAVYAAAWVGVIVTSLLALGFTRSRRVVEWAGASQIAQTVAIACAALREPGHSMAAVQLSAGVTAGAFALAMWLENSERHAWRFAAWLTLAGVPPLPGFFARIDGWSAMWHADLKRLAVISALAQVAVLYAIVRAVLASDENSTS
ncbi:MAG: hypothetical protein IT350_17540 [Deltaproteobacteria bacterium]|nr:hypothetical protein [Deltaproteobacteria bacterium]